MQRKRATPNHQKMFEGGRAALAPYQAAGHIRTFVGPATLFPGIRAIPAPGHSFYAIQNRGHRMWVIGDVVLSHLGEVVVKPANESGGYGMLIGPRFRSGEAAGR